MTKKSPQAMAKWAAATRARAEGTVVRGYFLNEVLPVITEEFERRLASGEAVVLRLPEVDAIAAEFVRQFVQVNALPELA